jgi:hypothetical protein
MTRRRLHSVGYWRILLDEILSLEFCPELRRNLGLHGGVICKDLLFAAHASAILTSAGFRCSVQRDAQH